MKKIIPVLSFALMAWTVSFAQVTTLQVIHNSADPLLDSIDVYVNVPLLSLDEKLLSDFPFRASFFSNLSAEINLFGGVLPVKVQITPAGQADTVINEAVTLIAGKTYLAFAAGVVDTTKFLPNPDGKSIALKLDTVERAPIGADTGFVKASFFNGVTDAPALDITIIGGGMPASNLAYGTFQITTDSFPAPPKPVDFFVTEHNSGKAIGTFAVDFSGYGGQAIVMYFAGFLHPDSNQNGAPLGLFIADTANNVVQVPEIASGVKTIGKNLSALNLYPNPATNVLNYKYTLTSSSDISVSVFNNAGALVYSRHFGMLTPGKYEESLDVSKFAAGIYTAKVGDAKNSSTGTFVRK